MKYLREGRGIPRWYLFDSANRLICCRVQPKDRRGIRDLKRLAELFEIGIQAFAEPRGTLFQLMVDIKALGFLQCRQAAAESPASASRSLGAEAAVSIVPSAAGETPGVS